MGGAVVVVGPVVAVPALAAFLIVASMTAQPLAADPSGAAVADIPPTFLRLYREAAAHLKLGADGWSYLAGVGKVECDHGRSTAVGCDRGEANYAGARGPAQFLLPTWSAYGFDGDGDGDRDIYDPVDAIFGMANYLRASGAPRDWRRALFAYNHAGWYVDKVVAQAARYRTATPVPGPLAGSVVPAVGDGWLADVPGQPGIQCDRRIVSDVVALARAYRLRVTACYATGHKRLGEHPLGLAIDAGPADGQWARTMRLARDYGWNESCAANGCGGRGVFRVVLYNGYPGHGDPAHTTQPHIHLSWQHAPTAPFTRAPWVRTLLPAGGGR